MAAPHVETQPVVSRHKTAMARTSLSRPIRVALEDGVLDRQSTIADYGCGQGGDIRRLTAMGYACSGWDPIHHPLVPCPPADVVNLGYVVNVIEDAEERRETLQRAWRLTRRVLVVSARLVAETGFVPARSLADGILTRIGTFQKFYEQFELRDWIASVTGEPPIAAAPGIFYVFRDREQRASFAASRFRRTPTAGEQRLDLTPEMRALLMPLERFVMERGRMPQPEEPGDWTPIVTEFGSIRSAYRRIERTGDPAVWHLIRVARSEDLLVFLALSLFEGRPRASDLPIDLRADVAAFFGGFAKACAAADAILFSLRDSGKVEAACRNAVFGKLLPNALYVSGSAVDALPVLLRLFEGCARNYVGSVDGANIVKLGRREPKVSYLSYPDFDRDPHPCLVASTTVDLRSLSIRQRQYGERDNPPILHRKEEFVPPGHPLRTKFARLTRAEQSKGLFDDPTRIGTRDGWRHALRDRGLELRGHRLIYARPKP